MQGKSKITIELKPDQVSEIIKKYFVEHKNVVIQEVRFNIKEEYSHEMDRFPTYSLGSVICTREEDVKI